MDDKQLKKNFDAIHRRLNKQLSPEWVKSSEITRLTGWDKEGMRRARLYGYVRWKKDNGFWYDINSINERFLIKKIA